MRPANQPEITEHYVKYIEPVYHEEQNTAEKNWSFKTKIYEVTEQRIAQLKKENIKISPSDYEWVIDVFEKLAINHGQQSEHFLKEHFKRVVSPELQSRVTDEIIKQLYDPLWKKDRENRKNRSFIREFWNSAQEVGEDNYMVFTT